MTTKNLLETPDLDPPLGDLFSFRTLSECRSIWTQRLPEESDAPEKRIIHTRIFKPHARAQIKRIGIRNATGAHKCGSQTDEDWIVDLRILTLDKPGDNWRECLYLRNLPEQESGAIRWLDLNAFDTCGLILEIRRCGIDGWWTPWNLAADAFIIEGLGNGLVAPRNENLLEVSLDDAATASPGLERWIHEGEVHFRSKHLHVGFFLTRPGCSFLAIDQTGAGKLDDNLLKVGPGAFHQGPLFTPTGATPIADRAVRFRFTGTTKVRSNSIVYQLEHADSGLSYSIEWQIESEAIDLKITRRNDCDIRAWRSAAWAMAFDIEVAPVHSFGPLVKIGQTGSLSSPFCLHAPRYGSLLFESDDSGVYRTECFRPQRRVESEFKVGEVALPEGDWLLPAGKHRSHWQIRLHQPSFSLRPETPDNVRKALLRTVHTGMTFRPDTATLSNSGASMVCPISMDTWAAQTVRTGEIIPGLQANELLRYSLERWLDGGPGYASGHLRDAGTVRSAEDEYLMTGAAALAGLAEFLEKARPSGWLRRYEKQVRKKLEEMKARDLDGDGLIESPYRTGTSGSGQWSTCWFDVISYGWKDAFTNAVLYEALETFSRTFPDSCMQDWVPDIENWATRLKEAYLPTFYNPDTGWLAGWHCKEGKLHDHAFIHPNGAAVAAGLVHKETGRKMLGALLDEMERVQVPSARNGLPGNLRHIPDEDLADIIQGYPLGYYQNGGRTHSQTRHFLRGLYRAGLTTAADSLLEELCQGFAEGLAFGGCNSGVDWRFWDDRPAGYEGLLTDQFGLLAVALDRYQE